MFNPSTIMVSNNDKKYITILTMLMPYHVHQLMHKTVYLIGSDYSSLVITGCNLKDIMSVSDGPIAKAHKH